MNPESLEEVNKIVKSTVRNASKSSITIICPPFVFLSSVSKHIKGKNVSLGAQNVFAEKKGAYTGEISAEMLKSFNVTHAIVGHSERRAMGETDEDISKKLLASWSSKIIPILCVGEQKRDDHGNYLEILKSQTISSLKLLPKSAISKVVIAYEPVWAIGSESKGAMSARELHETSIFIRKVLVDIYGVKAKETIIIYGGSVDAENAATLVREGEVDGLLVGRQSLNAKDFAQILKSVK